MTRPLPPPKAPRRKEGMTRDIETEHHSHPAKDLPKAINPPGTHHFDPARTKREVDAATWARENPEHASRILGRALLTVTRPENSDWLLSLCEAEGFGK